jgi:hypothetical protein
VKVGNGKLGGGALANSVITAKFSSSSLGKVISLDKMVSLRSRTRLEQHHKHTQGRGRHGRQCGHGGERLDELDR